MLLIYCPVEYKHIHSQSGRREKKRDGGFQARAEELFRPCLKTFVVPFLPAARLTAPWSPRMYLDMIMVEITAPT